MVFFLSFLPSIPSFEFYVVHFLFEKRSVLWYKHIYSLTSYTLIRHSICNQNWKLSAVNNKEKVSISILICYWYIPNWSRISISCVCKARGIHTSINIPPMVMHFISQWNNRWICAFCGILIVNNCVCIVYRSKNDNYSFKWFQFRFPLQLSSISGRSIGDTHTRTAFLFIHMFTNDALLLLLDPIFVLVFNSLFSPQYHIYIHSY